MRVRLVGPLQGVLDRPVREVVGDDIRELAQEMAAEMMKRNWAPKAVDWEAVEESLRIFLPQLEKIETALPLLIR